MILYTKHIWQSDRYFNFQYLLYFPPDYDATKSYPLVFFLHGAGERGEDLETVARYGYMKNVKDGENYPFIFAAPLCPQNMYWGALNESLEAFLDFITETLPVDLDRVYLTGLSMGGTGTWMLAMACPQKFAAVVPVCGTGICWNAGALKNLPIYIYHGDCDDIVPITESINMLSAINRQGGNAKIKICYGVGHNAWDTAYNDPELLDWMLAQKKR